MRKASAFVCSDDVVALAYLPAHEAGRAPGICDANSKDISINRFGRTFLCNEAILSKFHRSDHVRLNIPAG